MKSGILKLMLLSISLAPLIAQAAADGGTASGTTETQSWKIVKKPSATFDSGESEHEGPGAKLRTDQQIKDDAAASTGTSSATASATAPAETPATPSSPAAPSAATAPTDTVSTLSNRIDYEPGVTPPPRAAKKAKKSPPKATAQSTRATRNYAETAYRPSFGAEPAVAAVAVEAPPAPLALDAKAHWKIRTGERLSDVMVRWTKAIGWQLAWEPEDLIALADLDLEDTFTGATTKVINALNRNGADMQAQFYASNQMLRITARK